MKTLLSRIINTVNTIVYVARSLRTINTNTIEWKAYASSGTAQSVRPWGFVSLQHTPDAPCVIVAPQGDMANALNIGYTQQTVPKAVADSLNTGDVALF